MSARRTLAAVTLALIAASVMASCSIAGPGDPRTQERSIADVTHVRLETSGDLTISRGAVPSLTVTAGERVIDRLTSEVVDDELVLGLDGSSGSLGPVRYELDLPELEGVSVAGSGSAAVVAPDAEALSLSLAGSGDIDVRNSNSRALDVELAGSGVVRVSGTTDRQRVHLDGSGSYDAGDLTSGDAVVTVEGSGSAEVAVTDELDATVNGSGSIRHTGGARVTQAIEGSGQIVAG